ncbi:MAG: hypothetical protein JXA06_13350, partial [Bacteroidetes bacterium]|nr:hypothetical protein [Bacteroidota bacterium]
MSNRNPALTYNASPDAGYFTHYVDSSDPASTDSSNTYGSIAKPRKTIPKGLPAGSVVEVHNSANANSSGNCNLTGKGTAAMPIFVRGVGNPFINMTGLIGYTNDTEYLIVEGIEFSTITVHGRDDGLYNGNHISVRNCECKRLNCYSYISGSYLNNIVFYQNSVHDGGDWTNYTTDDDEGGISIQSRSSYVWVVDNESYHNQFNGIQILAYPQNVSPDDEIVPHHIYVGRNEFYENQQPGFWTKTARDVIFSQNISHGH